MENKCIYRDINTCAKKINTATHQGTILKFQVFSKYIETFLAKIVGQINKSSNFGVTTINFIECMCSSGLYINSTSTEFINGTAMYAIEIFQRYATKNPNLQFNMYFNDWDEQYISCIECLVSKYDKSSPPNLNIKTFSKDKYVFINKDLVQLKINSWENMNLIIYDPYDVDFDWITLSKILKARGDVLLTHFFQNDITRNIRKDLKQDAVLKYEKAYSMNFDELRNTFNSMDSPRKRSSFFRETFETQLKKWSMKDKCCYFPVFSSTTAVYDIVCLSKSIHAINLTKDAMYEASSNNPRKKEHIQLTLFDSDMETRREEESEFDFFYDDGELLIKFKEKYAGKYMKEKDFIESLKGDKFIPYKFKSKAKKEWPWEIKVIGKDKYLKFRNED